MSFASDVKKELTLLLGDDCCQLAELSALLRSNSEIFYSEHHLTVDFHTQNPTTAKRVLRLLREQSSSDVELITRKGTQLNKRNTYIIRVQESADELVHDLVLVDGLRVIQSIPERLIQAECDQRAYLRGVFIAAGSVNHPKSSNYHLELVLKDETHALDVLALLNQFDMNARMIERHKGFMIYVKEAEKISDFLKLIEANGSVMKFEDIRIYRDISNTVNRMNNCDIANQRKVMEAARRQLEDIMMIERAVGLKQLPQPAYEAARYRKRYPEASIIEIKEHIEAKSGKPISKSAINHRFRSIREFADKLRA
jgi:cell division protein WhiA